MAGDATIVAEKTDATAAAAVTDKTVVVVDAAAAVDKTAAAAATDTKVVPDKAATTVVDTKAADDKSVAAPAKWPDNWRDLLAEEIRPGDAKFRARLDRFTAPSEIGKSWLSIEQRQQSGELKPVLPKDAKPEQVEAFRKEAGLPEKPEGYVAALALPNGVVLGEADKPLVASLAEQVAHKGLWSQQQVNDVVSWYYQTQDAMALKQEESDGDFWQKTEDTLRAEWGADYRPNTNAVQNLVQRMPEGIRAHIIAARIPAPTKDDPGRTVRLMGHPEAIRFFAQMEREINPESSLTPHGGGGAVDWTARKAEIQRIMRTDRAAYDKDLGMQNEYRQILEKEERDKSRAA